MSNKSLKAIRTIEKYMTNEFMEISSYVLENGTTFEDMAAQFRRFIDKKDTDEIKTSKVKKVLAIQNYLKQAGTRTFLLPELLEYDFEIAGRILYLPEECINDYLIFVLLDYLKTTGDTRNIPYIFRLLKTEADIHALRLISLHAKNPDKIVRDIYTTSSVFGITTLLQDISAVLQNTKFHAFDDMFGRSQWLSKYWLCHELKNHKTNLGSVQLVGGWAGILAKYLNHSGIEFEIMRNFDIDEKSCAASDNLNIDLIKGWKLKSVHQDIMTFDYHAGLFKCYNNDSEQYVDFDTIINTSCEHLEFRQWLDKVPDGKTVVLQCANFKHDDHITIFNTLAEFRDRAWLSELWYEGELDILGGKRFMLIGKK